jgi:hypothetical protein
MQTTGSSIPEFSDLHLFRQWPEKTDAKVPSEISFSAASVGDEGKFYRQWGYSIDVNSKVLRWTKLELVRNRALVDELRTLGELLNGLQEVNRLHAEADDSADVPRHLSKTTEDIIESYLGHVAREWKAFIGQQGANVLNRVTVDVIITHPAVGSLPHQVLSRPRMLMRL